MKIRLGFVSNSSSSSFICDCCDESVEGYDLVITECENGHRFCEDCSGKVSDEEANENPIMYGDNKIEDEDDCEGDIDANSGYLKIRYCPICQMKIYNSEEVHSYLYKKNKTTPEKLFEEIKKKFTSWERFNKFLNKKDGK